MAKAKNLAAYLLSLPEKRITLTLQRPNARVHDYADGDFPLELVAVGVMIDGQRYISAFEMTNDVRDELMKVEAGVAVKVTLIADDSDSDTFPSIELA